MLTLGVVDFNHKSHFLDYPLLSANTFMAVYLYNLLIKERLTYKISA